MPVPQNLQNNQDLLPPPKKEVMLSGLLSVHWITRRILNRFWWNILGGFHDPRTKCFLDFGGDPDHNPHLEFLKDI